mgnify:CR=1 FL=1
MLPHKVMHLLCHAHGGMCRHVFDLAQGLNPGEFSPLIVASRRNTWLKKSSKGPVPLIPLDVCHWEKPFLPTGDLGKLISLLRLQRVVILHVHGFRAALWGRLAARVAGTPVVIYTVHGFPAKGPAIFGIERLLANWTSRIITVSHALRRELIRGGIPPYRITTIHNGVDVAGKIGGNIKDNRGWGYNVGIVGRLVKLKGVEYFLRAAAAVAVVEPRARFYVIGDGPRRSYLEGLVGDLSLDGVLYFTGHVDNMDKWWQHLDILVSCSLEEGLGLSILEAMAASLPVIGTRVGGIPEIIIPGLNGILVEPRDSRTLSSEILKLLHNPGWRTRLGGKGREMVLRRFTRDKMVAAVEKIYHQSLEITLGKANE